jgi:NAD(P)H-flavin reductase
MMNTAAALPGFICKLKDRKEVAEGTMAFRFEKPPGWTFKAGQYLDMTLLDPPETDSEGNVRSFSIASAPHEETLMVATRMRDTAFKRVLKTMSFGTAVKIEGPSGDLTLQNEVTRTDVFLAGGIWHHAVSKYRPLGSEGEVAESHCPLLFQQAARRCAVPRRASERGKR